MSARRVIVTGAGGFIGKRMVHYLRAAGEDVTAWTRADVDLHDRVGVAERLKPIQPTHIIHLAASPVGGGNEAWTGPAQEVAMLSHLVRAMPAETTLTYSGSMAEYGYAGCFSEWDACYPQTAYGFAKNSCTQFALAARLGLGRDVRVARLFGVFGPGEARRRLFPALVSGLVRGVAVPLSDGLQVRDFVHVDEVCARLWDLTSTGPVGEPLVNIGSGVGVTVRAACEAVADMLGADRDLLRFGHAPRRTVDEDCLVARTERLARLGPVPRPLLPLVAGPAASYLHALAEECRVAT